MRDEDLVPSRGRDMNEIVPNGQGLMPNAKWRNNMSTVLPVEHVREVVAKPPRDVPQPPTNLREEDGIPLESEWHRLAMTLLIELVGLHLQGRDDYFVGGNMFVYFSSKQVRDEDFRGPDFFFVWNVPLNPPRRYWAVWDEGGRYPDVIIELASPTTVKEDHGIKKTTYESVFHTSEYFIYDPARKKLEGCAWTRISVTRKLNPTTRVGSGASSCNYGLGPGKGNIRKGRKSTCVSMTRTAS